MRDIVQFPRKRRTREHVIADQGVNLVEHFIFAAGFTVERVLFDYGYDLSMTTYDASGFVEAGRVLVQVKAAERLKASADGKHVSFALDRRDVNLWLDEPMPVFLVLYEASSRRGFWLQIQRHFLTSGVGPRRNRAASVRVLIPKTNRMTRRAIEF